MTDKNYPWWCVSPELYDRQLELEQECVSLGEARYWRNLEQRGDDNTGVGQRIIASAIEDVGQSIDGWLNAGHKAGASAARNGSIAWFLRLMEPEVIALAGLKVVVNCIRQQASLTQTAIQVAKMLESHLCHEYVRKENEGFFQAVESNLKRTTSDRHRHRVMEHAARQLDVDYIRLPNKDRIKVGRMVLERVIEATGLIQVSRMRQSDRQQYSWTVIGTAEGVEWLEESHDRASVMMPMALPMIHPPKAWTTPWNGGALTKALRRVQPMVIRKTGQGPFLQELAGQDMPDVYRAINAVQGTRWQINQDVLTTFRQLWEARRPVADLPERDPLPLPVKPEDIDTNQDSRRQWRRRAASVHETNNRMVSKRAATAQVLWIASKFENEQTIYFPQQLDWRGRMYSIPKLLNPQGSDLSKGLLRFADGKRLGDTGVWWFKIHLANLFGVDKVSYPERVQWVDDHTDLLLDSGQYPQDGSMFWTEADDPWQALAACFEFVSVHRDGPDAISHIPVAVDGTCSGLQHFSALLRDRRGGRAVNMTPTEQPQDIYAEVATEVNTMLQDVVDEGISDKAWLAQRWSGKIDRKLVKRPTMTQPYGVTQYGMVGQIRDLLEGEAKDAHAEATYLAGHVHSAIGNIVVAARTAMDWMRHMAKHVASEGLPVWWETPVGFLVSHDYWEAKVRHVHASFGSARVKSAYRDYTDTISKSDMTRGIAPNFIHSMDAAHLKLTVSQLSQEGYESFGMVHDSFAMHACDVPRLQECIRRLNHKSSSTTVDSIPLIGQAVTKPSVDHPSYTVAPGVGWCCPVSRGYPRCRHRGLQQSCGHDTELRRERSPEAPASVPNARP